MSFLSNVLSITYFFLVLALNSDVDKKKSVSLDLLSIVPWKAKVFRITSVVWKYHLSSHFRGLHHPHFVL